MKQPVVVVDANQIIERDWRIEKPMWQVVLGLAATGQITLVVPEVVVRECAARFRSKSLEPSHALARLGIEFDLDQMSISYERELRGRLVEAGAVLRRDDPTTLLDLVDQAVERKPPFDDKGNGFRDAILWAYVAQLVVGSHVVFLTNDNDFLVGKDEDRRLHPDLAVSATGGVLQWYPDIRGWFEASGRSATNPKVEGRLLRLIQNDRAQFDANVVTAIEQASLVVCDLSDVEVTIESAAPPIEIVNTTLIEESANARFLVRIAVQADAAGIARKSSPLGAVIEGEFAGCISAEVEAFYDVDTDQLENIRVEVVEVDPRDAVAALNSGRLPLSGIGYAPSVNIEGLTELSARLADMAPLLPTFDVGTFVGFNPEILEGLVPKWTASDLGINPEFFKSLLPKLTPKDFGIDITGLPAFEALSKQLGEQMRQALENSKSGHASDADETPDARATGDADADEGEADEPPPT